jgi:transcriptional regulator with XRE-family HTH domain
MSFSIKEARLNRGLTLRALAEEAGVSLGAAARAEAGKAVNPENAKALADYFDCKVTDIWPVEPAEAKASAA